MAANKLSGDRKKLDNRFAAIGTRINQNNTPVPKFQPSKSEYGIKTTNKDIAVSSVGKKRFNLNAFILKIFSTSKVLIMSVLIPHA